MAAAGLEEPLLNSDMVAVHEAVDALNRQGFRFPTTLTQSRSFGLASKVKRKGKFELVKNSLKFLVQS